MADESNLSVVDEEARDDTSTKRQINPEQQEVVALFCYFLLLLALDVCLYNILESFSLFCIAMNPWEF